MLTASFFHTLLLLQLLRYPAFAGGLLSNWEFVEGMKESCCYPLSCLPNPLTHVSQLPPPPNPPPPPHTHTHTTIVHVSLASAALGLLYPILDGSQVSGVLAPPPPNPLPTRYPAFAGGLLSNWQLIDGMKESCCYQAQDYGGLLQKAMGEPATAGMETFSPGKGGRVGGGGRCVLLAMSHVCQAVWWLMVWVCQACKADPWG